MCAPPVAAPMERILYKWLLFIKGALKVESIRLPERPEPEVLFSPMLAAPNEPTVGLLVEEEEAVLGSS